MVHVVDDNEIAHMDDLSHSMGVMVGNEETGKKIVDVWADARRYQQNANIESVQREKEYKTISRVGAAVSLATAALGSCATYLSIAGGNETVAVGSTIATSMLTVLGATGSAFAYSLSKDEKWFQETTEKMLGTGVVTGYVVSDL